MLWSQKEVKEIVERYFFGNISLDQMFTENYLRTGAVLQRGVAKGLNISWDSVDYNTPDGVLAENLRLNVWIFSAAKEYQEVIAMNELINQYPTWLEFQGKAVELFGEMNGAYLRAEYNAATGQSAMASKWQSFQETKKSLPYLKYLTVGDANVRDEHKILDGIVRRVDDSFWNRYMPKNGWNCRCTVVNLDLGIDAEKVTDLTDFKDLDEKKQPEMFRYNAGKTQQVFTKQHPYFEIKAKDKELARQNFNLPIPDKDGRF